ncbi:3933_t:CDS:2 [Ambispora gerdemannii]|uniref:3933_t:CDS:1 n=1 Tax=Ambispora gerdemannii TaxID=144530 RepID=A0A9N8VTN8_9GLOM|nr:3933_t:CDS:2 [Ambispora gerdemannii]
MRSLSHLCSKTTTTKYHTITTTTRSCLKKSSLKRAFATVIFILLSIAQPSFARDNVTLSNIDCLAIGNNCGACSVNLECGFCVTDQKCVQGGWNGPFNNPSICQDRWEYQFGQCFITHKIALISVSSALVGSSIGTDEERNPLLGGESVATHHFRRASFYNYNRNRPFERRGRTLSSGTANSTMQYGRNWRNTDEYMYGYGGPSMLWENDHNPPPTAVEDFSVGSQGNGNPGEWRRWEKKREELLAKYGKSSDA